MAAHGHGLEGIKTAQRAGANSIEHGSTLDEEAIRLFRESGAWHVPATMAFEWVVQGAREGRLTPHSAEKALENAYGTDAGVFPHGRNAEEGELAA